MHPGEVVDILAFKPKFLEFLPGFLEISFLIIIADVLFFSTSEGKDRPKSEWPKVFFKDVFKITLMKNGITFTICGHFCAVKSCDHIDSIPLWCCAA